MPAGRPSIGVALHERVEIVLRDQPGLGYQSTAELVRDLLRRWLEEHEAQRALASAKNDPTEDKVAQVRAD